ncbi:hypothetical protein V7S43_007321 [Phytophthora oleae]|uniref:DUSP domain-containing protein n=1 Tax=Phytophthora oleae TaxID=2107226 RepID=A0ABD3FN80_9STRA
MFLTHGSEHIEKFNAKRLGFRQAMGKLPSEPSCDSDWLVVGNADDSRESIATDSQPCSPSKNSPEKKQRGLETSQNQILDQESDIHVEPESDSNQKLQQHCGLVLNLLVWHDKLETPTELLDDDQKPLLVTADRSCSKQTLLKMIQEMVLLQPELREIFPDVNREALSEEVQVCERLEGKWMPLRTTEPETHQFAGNNGEISLFGDSNSATLKLTSHLDLLDERQCNQLLVETKFASGERTDWRRGRFYSDIQENAWRFELQIGQLVDALDTDRHWYESRIVDIGPVYVKVHYRGWTSKWDEWVRRTSKRLAPLHTEAPNWRVFQVGDEILAGAEVPGKRYPEWREARVTACAIEDDSLQIEVEVDGKKKWMDAQDELLCQKGTHEAINAGEKMNSAFRVPQSLLVNYFERPEELPTSPSQQQDPVEPGGSIVEATDAMQLADSDADGDEWCVVDSDDNHSEHSEENAKTVALTASNNQTDAAVVGETTVSEGSDTDRMSAEIGCTAESSDEELQLNIRTPLVNQSFTTTAEVLGGQVDTTISDKDAWRYQLQTGQLIDGRDTDNVWYESRVVAVSSTLVKIHYRGWTPKWDEWIERTSTRIAPLHTKVRNWRAFKVGDSVMVGWQVVTKKYPEWRNAIVTACEACEVDGCLRIQVDVDGSKRWMDAQDEMLCLPGTHKAVNWLMPKHMPPLF